jgi:hypothetical protein
MRLVALLLSSFICLGVRVSPAFAQAGDRGFVRGLASITFVTETGGVFAGGVGVSVHPHVQIVAEVGGFTNVLPKHLQRDLDDAARALEGVFGTPLVIDGQAPGGYGFGGFRLNAPARGRLAPFAEIGGGVAHGRSDITATVGGIDVSEVVTDALGVKESETAGLFGIGGGVGIGLGPTSAIDLGYRYMRIFTDDPRINVSMAFAAFRWRF